MTNRLRPAFGRAPFHAPRRALLGARLAATLCTAVAAPLSAQSQWCGAAFDAASRDRGSRPSLSGLPGLFEVPAAASAPDRSTTLLFHSERTSSVRGATQQRNALVSFGFLPGLTLAARGSVMDNAQNEGMRDISANAQLLLSRETGWRPSVAVGAQDLGGQASSFKARYLVLSKTLLGRARATVGYGTGLHSLDGAFGGLEVSPCPWLSLIGENDGRLRNFGVRLAPFGSWGTEHGVEPTLDLIWRETQGRMASVGLRVQSGSPAERRTPARPTPRSPRAAQGAPDTAGVRSALVAQGFENVRVALVHDTIAVAYENRVFNLSEWDALGVAMGETARHARAGRAMRFTLLRVDVPVMQVSSGVREFEAFVDGTLAAPDFTRQLSVGYGNAEPDGNASNSSAFHLDLTVRPRIETLVLTEISVAEFRSSLIPEASLQLGHGFSLTGRHAVVVHTTTLFPKELEDPNADQLVLHAARSGVPFAGGLPGVISQLSVGRFGGREVGASAAFDAVIADGTVSLGGQFAAFGDQPGTFRRSVALGSVRHRYAPLDLATSLTAGRFKYGDVGGQLEVERRFGVGEVAFYAQKTNIAAIAGARVSFPLTGARDLKPGLVRVHLPDYYDYRKWTQVFHPTNDVRTDVAQPLLTGQELPRLFRGRDRLNEPRLGREVERLRDAAIRWVVP